MVVGKACLRYLSKECPNSQLPDIPTQSAAAAYVTSTTWNRAGSSSSIGSPQRGEGDANVSDNAAVRDGQRQHQHVLPTDTSFGLPAATSTPPHYDMGTGPLNVSANGATLNGLGGPAQLQSTRDRAGNGSHSPFRTTSASGRHVARSVSDTRRGPRPDDPGLAFDMLDPPRHE